MITQGFVDSDNVGWIDGGYFGSIYQVRAMLPKAEVSLSDSGQA
jgi:hypothetical protein